MTGSGKTEVYLRAIAATLAVGRGAVWLVPEISLTPFFARELSRLFGDRAAVWHSALSERERAEAWARVRDGRARVVIGPRSAAFAPVEDPGLFVVDEEHDASYKQREAPRYDAREVAAIRARAASAVLVFGSATPSVEAYHAGPRREAHPARAHRARRESGAANGRDRGPAPREGPPRGEGRAPVLRAARRAFAGGLSTPGSRRSFFSRGGGFARCFSAARAGSTFACASAASAARSMTAGRALVCHYCGGGRSAGPLPRLRRCAARGHRGRHRAGRRSVRRALPGCGVRRLDRDTARRPRRRAVVLGEITSGKVQCLIGTQMVAKGHDFPAGDRRRSPLGRHGPELPGLAFGRNVTSWSRRSRDAPAAGPPPGRSTSRPSSRSTPPSAGRRARPSRLCGAGARVPAGLYLSSFSPSSRRCSCLPRTTIAPNLPRRRRGVLSDRPRSPAPLGTGPRSGRTNPGPVAVSDPGAGRRPPPGRGRAGSGHPGTPARGHPRRRGRRPPGPALERAGGQRRTIRP